VATALRFETCRLRVAALRVEVSPAGCTQTRARDVKSLAAMKHDKKPQNLTSIPLEALVTVPGGAGISQQAARQILQRKFPGAKLDFPGDITASGRPFQTRRGGWRGGVETKNDAFEVIVSPKGRVMRDPLGQGDL
jgi:hypothetical protein